jgi:hypothetical protein
MAMRSTLEQQTDYLVINISGLVRVDVSIASQHGDELVRQQVCAFSAPSLWDWLWFHTY